jgi:hypothetical protein
MFLNTRLLKNLILATFIFLISAKAFSSTRIKVEDVNFSSSDGIIKTIVNLNSAPNSIPEIFVRDNIFQLTFNNAYIWPKIDKQIKIEGQNVQVFAYQFDKD